MKHPAFHILAAGLVLAGLFAARPALGQYREYYILGKVVDPQKQPLEGVEITLRDEATSRSYSLKTKKDGTFKFAGLPHGAYKVSFKKSGYAVKEDEWKFTEPPAEHREGRDPAGRPGQRGTHPGDEPPEGGRGRGQGGRGEDPARATSTAPWPASRASSTRTPRTRTPST